MGNIYLTGFMAAGKSVVGKKLSQVLQWDYLDLDELIVKNTDLEIAELIKKHGEEYFRSLETEMLAKIADQHQQVVSLGGGTIISEANRLLLRRSGIIICLDVSLDQALLRSVKDNGLEKRPLLSKAQDLYRARKKLYQKADFIIDTNKITVEEVVIKAQDYLNNFFKVTPLSIDLKDKKYDVIVKPMIMGELAARLKQFNVDRNLIIFSDQNVWEIYQESISNILAKEGIEFANWNVIPSEEEKSLQNAAKAYDFLISKGVKRDDFCLIFGGGLIGDLGGFIVSTYMRGIPYIQIPTSLLAQVDSSVGGKVAVNHPQVKNLIGTFYHPQLCIIDPLLLRSLPQRKYIEGLAEVIKYALLEGGDLLNILEKERPKILSADPLVLSKIIRECCAIKAKYVVDDEKDFSIRRYLNLGHTLGHALESILGYGKLYHGEAVALGLIWASQLSENLKLAAAGLTDFVVSLLKQYQLPTKVDNIQDDIDKDQLLAIMLKDKKADRGGLNCVLLRAAGDVLIKENIDNEELKKAMRAIGL